MQPLATVVVYVTDVGRSVTFYSHLGFGVTSVREDHATVDFGVTSLQLHQEDAESIPEFVEGAAVRPRGASIYWYFPVADIDEWFKSHGAFSSYDAPRERPWGKREVLVLDPDGFQLMFYS